MKRSSLKKNIVKNFYSFEGGEGVGKSTVIKKLTEKLTEAGHVVKLTREPGGTDLAEEIRNLIFENEMSKKTEVLLFAASRADHLQKVIIPALNRGEIVLCDRFVDSSIVYQSSKEGILESEIIKINDFVVEETYPHKTFLFDLDPEIAQKRIINVRDNNRFDLEKMEFHTFVRNKYLELAQNNSRFLLIDASLKPEEIAHKIFLELTENE